MSDGARHRVVMVRTPSFGPGKLSRVALMLGTATLGCLVDDSSDNPAPPSAASGAGGATGGTMSGAAGTTGGAMAGAGGATGGTMAGGPTAGTGGGGASAGGAGHNDAGTAGSAGVAACVPFPEPQTCDGFFAPAWGERPATTPGVVIDFASYEEDGTWGDADAGQLTGGTSLYHGPNDENLETAAEDGSLRLTGTITPRGYVGVVFWFRACVDASEYGGIAFSVGGTTGGAVMKAQIQTHVDYPVDVASSKGGCSFESCDTKFMECAGPTSQLVVPRTPDAVEVPWNRFTAGRPTPRVTPDGLVGLQYQLECQSNADCVFDLTLGTVSFTVPTAPN